MFTTMMFGNLVTGMGSVLSNNRQKPALRDLPPEVREDLGYPDSCAARMSVRGHQKPCHEH